MLCILQRKLSRGVFITKNFTVSTLFTLYFSVLKYSAFSYSLKKIIWIQLEILLISPLLVHTLVRVKEQVSMVVTYWRATIQ